MPLPWSIWSDEYRPMTRGMISAGLRISCARSRTWAITRSPSCFSLIGCSRLDSILTTAQELDIRSLRPRSGVALALFALFELLVVLLRLRNRFRFLGLHALVILRRRRLKILLQPQQVVVDRHVVAGYRGARQHAHELQERLRRGGSRGRQRGPLHDRVDKTQCLRRSPVFDEALTDDL